VYIAKNVSIDGDIDAVGAINLLDDAHLSGCARTAAALNLGQGATTMCAAGEPIIFLLFFSPIRFSQIFFSRLLIVILFFALSVPSASCGSATESSCDTRRHVCDPSRSGLCCRQRWTGVHALPRRKLFSRGRHSLHQVSRWPDLPHRQCWS
jgi:hypothetical protein